MSSRGGYFFKMLQHTEVKYTLSKIHIFFLLGNHKNIHTFIAEKSQHYYIRRAKEKSIIFMKKSSNIDLLVLIIIMQNIS